MSNVETNLIKPFPVAFSGHTLKYEIFCNSYTMLWIH